MLSFTRSIKKGGRRLEHLCLLCRHKLPKQKVASSNLVSRSSKLDCCFSCQKEHAGTSARQTSERGSTGKNNFYKTVTHFSTSNHLTHKNHTIIQLVKSLEVGKKCISFCITKFLKKRYILIYCPSYRWWQKSRQVG